MSDKPFAPRHFIQLFDGRHRSGDGSYVNFAVVGFLPLHIGAHLPTTSTEIRLGQDYARKLVKKHKLFYEEIYVVNELPQNCYCFRQKTRHLTFIGYPPSRNFRPYLMVLKANASGTEVWLSTLYRTKEEQVRSKLREARANDCLIAEIDRPFDE